MRACFPSPLCTAARGLALARAFVRARTDARRPITRCVPWSRGERETRHDERAPERGCRGRAALLAPTRLQGARGVVFRGAANVHRSVHRGVRTARCGAQRTRPHPRPRQRQVVADGRLGVAAADQGARAAARLVGVHVAAQILVAQHDATAVARARRRRARCNGRGSEQQAVARRLRGGWRGANVGRVAPKSRRVEGGLEKLPTDHE